MEPAPQQGRPRKGRGGCRGTSLSWSEVTRGGSGPRPWPGANPAVGVGQRGKVGGAPGVPAVAAVGLQRDADTRAEELHDALPAVLAVVRRDRRLDQPRVAARGHVHHLPRLALRARAAVVRSRVTPGLDTPATFHVLPVASTGGPQLSPPLSPALITDAGVLCPGTILPRPPDHVCGPAGRRPCLVLHIHWAGPSTLGYLRVCPQERGQHASSTSMQRPRRLTGMQPGMACGRAWSEDRSTPGTPCISGLRSQAAEPPCSRQNAMSQSPPAVMAGLLLSIFAMPPSALQGSRSWRKRVNSSENSHTIKDVPSVSGGACNYRCFDTRPAMLQ